MKKSLAISLMMGGMAPVGWAHLTVSLEAALVACKYVKRTSPPFLNSRREDLSTPEEALHSDWLESPSSDFSFTAFEDNPSRFEYHSAYCEDALQRAIYDKLGSTKAGKLLKTRCLALRKNDVYDQEVRGDGNSWLDDHTSAHSSTNSYWCGSSREDESLYIQIACQTQKATKDLHNQDGEIYTQALAHLKKRCGTSSGITSNDDSDDDDDSGGSHGHVNFSAKLPGNYNVPVMRNVVTIPSQSRMGGCGSNAAKALVINPPGGAMYSIANAAVALGGIVASTIGGMHADDLKYKLDQSTLKAYQQVGAVPNLYAGNSLYAGNTMFGQGGAYPYGGGMLRGGVCGSPPYNTAYTGCMGGMPGQLPVGPGSIYGNGFSPLGGGGIAPWNGVTSPYGPSPYMNPGIMGQPYGMSTPFNPYTLGQQGQQLGNIQGMLPQQNPYAMPGINSFNQLSGYNGILASNYGPAGYYGNAGVYNPGLNALNGIGSFNNGLAGGCGSIACYPGNPGAYNYSPYIYGNSGYGSSAYGYPPRNNINFAFGTNFTETQPKKNSESAR